MPLVAAIEKLDNESLMIMAAEAFPDIPYYIVASDRVYFVASDGFACRHALEYRGVYFCNGVEYYAKFPQNLYILMIASGYYSSGDASEVFPSMVLRPDPALIADPRKRALHILINNFIMERTGCPAFLLGEKPYMGPEAFEDTVDIALNAVYSGVCEFLNEGYREITSYDRMMIELRKRLAAEFDMPRLVNV